MPRVTLRVIAASPRGKGVMYIGAIAMQQPAFESSVPGATIKPQGEHAVASMQEGVVTLEPTATLRVRFTKLRRKVL